MRKVKLLYILSTLKRSGPVIQLYNLIKYLDSSRYEVSVITLSPEPEDSKWEDFRDLKIGVRTLGLSRIGGIFLLDKKVSRLISSMDPDVVHTQGFRADRLRISRPRIATIHNFPQFDYILRYGRLMGAVMVELHMSALRRCHVVGVSNAVAINLKSVFKIDHVAAIQNGVDTEVFYPAFGENKLALRQELQLPLRGRIWISSGHLSDLKDPLFLVKAWKEKGISSGDHLVFIGNGELYDELRRISQKNDNIHVLGRVTRVADYLRAGDYFVSASKSEGLPNSVMEALASGLPILLSNISPHEEIWKLNPSIGSLYLQGDQASFLEAFNEVALLEPERIGAACTDLVKTKLSGEIMSLRYQKLYENILEG